MIVSLQQQNGKIYSAQTSAKAPYFTSLIDNVKAQYSSGFRNVNTAFRFVK